VVGEFVGTDQVNQPPVAPVCPHCLLSVDGVQALPFPSSAMRCPHCRLIIGAGRARAQADERSSGTAAGILANAARREGGVAAHPKVITVALNATAASLGCQVQRLRMLDYQHETQRDQELPSLASVLAAHGSWKEARRAAAEATPPPEDRLSRDARGSEAL
jgi:hypothetical protein